MPAGCESVVPASQDEGLFRRARVPKTAGMGVGRWGLALLVGSMIVAAASTASAGTAMRTSPASVAKVLAASREEQRAIQVLASGVASNGRRYKEALAHVNTAIADLDAAARSLAAIARKTGPPSNSPSIDRLLNRAYAGDNHASVQLAEALWLLSKHAPTDNTHARAARAELRTAAIATDSLARLLK
jgi:hypothetical protein